MPAQPPFFTPTRTPMIGRSALAMMSLTRFAAASVRLTTLKLGRAMSLSGGRVQGPGRTRGSCILDKRLGGRGRGGVLDPLVLSAPRIRRPKPRRGELKQMPVRVTDIEALPAARPRRAALDRDAGLAETLLPSCEVGGVDREGDVERPMAVVRRNGAAGQPHGLKRRAET